MFRCITPSHVFLNRKRRKSSPSSASLIISDARWSYSSLWYSRSSSRGGERPSAYIRKDLWVTFALAATTVAWSTLGWARISRAPPVLRIVRVAAPPRVRHSSHAVCRCFSLLAASSLHLSSRASRVILADAQLPKFSSLVVGTKAVS